MLIICIIKTLQKAERRYTFILGMFFKALNHALSAGNSDDIAHSLQNNNQPSTTTLKKHPYLDNHWLKFYEEPHLIHSRLLLWKTGNMKALVVFSTR